MAEGYEINIRGIDETCDALTRLPKNVVKNAFAKALAAAAAPMVERLRPATPKHTGDLAAHLMSDIQVDTDGRGGNVSVGFGKEGYKARLVEFGHRMVGHEPNKVEVGLVMPRPFMRPAAAEAAEESTEAFNESITESVDQGIPGSEA